MARGRPAGGALIVAQSESATPVDEAQVIEVLRECYDPEIPVNIVDLGLVYDLEIGEGGEVRIEMTLTTPGCPLHDAIDGAVQRALGTVPGVNGVQVDLVWAPPWTPEMMSDPAKERLGWGIR